MNKVFLISESTLKKYTLINDNLDGVYIAPAIQLCQDIDLDTVIGPVLNNKLQSLVEDGSISYEENKNYKKLLDEYVTPYMCWSVMASIQLNINYKLSNSGVITNEDERKSHLDYQNNKNLQTQYERYASSYANKLRKYLDAHTSIYPEYKQCKDFEYAESPALCSIYLGDYDCDRHNYIGK